MREIVKGHLYALQNLHSSSETYLQFFQDPALHGDIREEGPNTQEVIRACIARVKALNEELPWPGNENIIYHLRCALAGFEARAIIRKTEKGMMIEALPVGLDGHLTVSLGEVENANP